MTSLETQLLNALDELSNQFDQQHQASQQAQSELRRMFEITSTENAELKRQVDRLNDQLTSLSRRLGR